MGKTPDPAEPIAARALAPAVASSLEVPAPIAGSAIRDDPFDQDMEGFPGVALGKPFANACCGQSGHMAGVRIVRAQRSDFLMKRFDTAARFGHEVDEHRVIG